MSSVQMQQAVCQERVMDWGQRREQKSSYYLFWGAQFSTGDHHSGNGNV